MSMLLFQFIPPFLAYVHKSVLYVCVSVSALQNIFFLSIDSKHNWGYNNGCSITVGAIIVFVYCIKIFIFTPIYGYNVASTMEGKHRLLHKQEMMERGIEVGQPWELMLKLRSEWLADTRYLV